MRFFILASLFFINLFSTTLLTYNTYDRDDRVDLMLSFDTPYNGKIYLKKDEKNFIITLNNLIFNKSVTKNINSKIIQEIKIEPSGNSTKIYIKSDTSIQIIASKTTDGFGLRIRATPTQSIVSNQQKIKNEKQNLFSNLKTNDKGYSVDRYYLMLSALFIIVIILLFIKNRLKKEDEIGKNWLFKGSVKGDKNQVKIIYKKMIDPKNSVLVLEYLDRRYLVLSGSSNQLLDKFSKDSLPIEDDEEEFEKIFAKNREKLDEFLKIENDKLSNYREKVSQEEF